jgi:hypothetical protein
MLAAVQRLRPASRTDCGLPVPCIRAVRIYDDYLYIPLHSAISDAQAQRRYEILLNQR